MKGEYRPQSERIRSATAAIDLAEQLLVLGEVALIVDARPYGNKRATVEAICSALHNRGIFLDLYRVAEILANTERAGLTHSNLTGARLTGAGEAHLWRIGDDV